MSFKDKVFGFFGAGDQGRVLNTVNYGDIEIGKWERRGLVAREALVDSTAAVTYLEKLLNQKVSGNFERFTANYSATAALGWRRRSSQINAAMIRQGQLKVKFLRPGDIQSATLEVVDDPDSLISVFRTILEPGPVNSITGKQEDKSEIFKTYATAMRGRGLKASGQPVPRELTDTYINQAITSIERDYPEIVDAYKRYQRFNKKLLESAVDAGLITQSELANLTTRMDYYGFYREVYEQPLVPGTATKTASKFNLRPYKGSEHGGLVNDPIFVMITNAQFWVDAIAKNIAATKSFEVARQMGEARILGTSEEPDPAQGEEKQVMFFRKDGVQKRFAVKDPLLVTALGSDDRTDVGRFFQLLGMPTTILRESVTRDPGFIFANLARDTLSAWITSGEDITPFIGTAKGFAKALKQSASFKDLMGMGVVGSYDLAMLPPAELAAKMRRIAAPKNVHFVPNGEAALSAWNFLVDKSGTISEASDAATRIAVYESAIKQGFTKEEAAFRAIEIMDFSRRGGSHVLAILTKIVPFLNARIQGLDVLYQAGKSAIKLSVGKAESERERNIGKKFLVRGGMLAVISMVLEMINQDDEDYQQLDNYIKDSNLLIPLSYFGMEGQFLAIPKPFEAGLLFSTFPQQFYKSAILGEATTRENINMFVYQVGSTFGVNPIPQVALPAFEVLVNHDFYTGLPLVSEGKARLAPELQYNSRTSKLAMMLGELPVSYNMTTGRFEGISPIVIDNLISGYGGPLGTYLVEAVSLAMETANVGPEVSPREIYNAPVVRRFFIDAESKNPRVVTQAYELFKIVDEANRSYSRLRQIGDAEAVKDYLDENRDILSYKKYVFKMVDRLNKLSAYERRIQADKEMSDDEKLEAMRRLRETRMKIAAKVSEINKALGR